MLYNLGVLVYSPPLNSRIRRLEDLESGHSWEMELRGCSIWAVELMRRQIAKDHAEVEADVHAVLLDFLLYDLAKEVEASGKLHISVGTHFQSVQAPASARPISDRMLKQCTLKRPSCERRLNVTPHMVGLLS
jgi:hypothetical protein